MKFSIELSRKAQTAKEIITNSQIFRAIFNIIGDESPIYLSRDVANFMKAYQENNVVYSVINPIVKRCSNMPLVHTDGKNSEILKLLKRPNPMSSQAEFIQSVMANLAACGIAIIWKNKPVGRVTELWNVPAKDVTIRLSDKLGITGYDFGWRTDKVPAEDVILLRLANPDNTNPGQNITGLSPLNACIDIITEVNEAIRANAKMLKNRMPRTMVSARANAQITPEQMKELQKQMEKAGSDDKFFATSAPLQAAAFGLSPVDLAIHQTLTRAKRDIAAVYSVPFEYFEPSTYSNKNDAKQDFINNAVLPLFNVFVEALNADPDLTKFMKSKLIIDFQQVPELRKDLVSLSGALSTSWWLTGNEKRIAMDYQEVADPLLNTVIVPAGMVPIDQLNEANNQFNI